MSKRLFQHGGDRTDLGQGAPEKEDKLVASFCVSRPQALSQLVATKKKKKKKKKNGWWRQAGGLTNFQPIFFRIKNLQVYDKKPKTG